MFVHLLVRDMVARMSNPKPVVPPARPGAARPVPAGADKEGDAAAERAK